MSHTPAPVTESAPLTANPQPALPPTLGTPPVEPGFGVQAPAPAREAPAPPDRRQSAGAPPAGQVEHRQSAVDRRAGVDRRVIDIGSPTGLERRRGPGRRRSDDRRSAEEGEMTDEQFEFVLAIDTYKRLNSRPFPTWTEILEVVKQLGYRKVAASSLNLSAATARSRTAPPAPTPYQPNPAPVKESEFMPG